MAAVVSPAVLPQPPPTHDAPSLSSSSSPTSPPKSFTRIFRSSFQETLRHVSVARKAKDLKDKATVSDPREAPTTPAPPSAFFDRHPRPSAFRRSLDSPVHPERPQESRKPKDKPREPKPREPKPREPHPRRSFDVLTQKSASTSFSQASSASQSTSDRDPKQGRDNCERPRVLRKQPSSTSKRRPGADSPDPQPSGGRLSPTSDPSRSAGIRRLLSPIAPSHLQSQPPSHTRSQAHPHSASHSQSHSHSRSLTSSPVPRSPSPAHAPPSPPHGKRGTATGTSPDRSRATARDTRIAASPNTIPDRDADSDTDREDPIWSPFLPPTLSKGNMSSPTLLALRDAAEPDSNYSRERTGGYDAKHARERIGREGLRDTALKQPQIRKQRSPLTSIGSFLSSQRARKLSFSGAGAPLVAAPNIAARSTTAPTATTQSGSHTPTHSIESTRAIATPTPSASTPTPRTTFESTRTPTSTSKAAPTPSTPTPGPSAPSPTSASNTTPSPSPTPVPAPVPLSVSTKTKTKPGRPVPHPLVISRPKAMMGNIHVNSSNGNGHVSGHTNGNIVGHLPGSPTRASPTPARTSSISTPTLASTPKTSRLIGIGHPSTSHRRSEASASTSHLPLPGSSAGTTSEFVGGSAVASTSTSTLASTSAPAAGLSAARSTSPPASPTRRARSPTASTSASRARERATSPASRPTSPTTIRRGASSPASGRATSPASRATSPSTATTTPRATSPTTASPTQTPNPARRPSGINTTKAAALGMRIGKGSISASHLPLSSTGSTSHGARAESPPPGRVPTPGSPGTPRLVPRRPSGSGAGVGMGRTSTRSPSPMRGSAVGAGTGVDRIRSASSTSLIGPGVSVSSSPSEGGDVMGQGIGRGGTVGSSFGGNAGISPERQIIRCATGALVKAMLPSSSGTAAGNTETEGPPGTRTTGTAGTLAKPPLALSKDARDAVEGRMRSLARLERIWRSAGGTGGEGSGGAGGLTDDKERRAFGDALKDGYVLCQYLNAVSLALVCRPDPSATSSARAANLAKFAAAAMAFGVPPDAMFERRDLEGGITGLARVAKCVMALERLAGERAMGDKAGEELVKDRAEAKPGAPPSPSPGSRTVTKSPSSAAVGSPSAIVYTVHSVGSASTPNLPATGGVSPTGSSAKATVLAGRAVSPASPSMPGIMRQKQMTQIQKQKHQKRWSPTALPTVKSSSPADDEGRVSREHNREGDMELQGEDEDVFGPMEFVDGTVPLSPQRVGARSSIASSSQATDTTNAHSSLLDPRLSMHTRYGTIRTMTTDATSLGTDVPSLTRTEASAVAADLDMGAANVPYRSRSAGAIMPNGGGEESPRRRDRKASDVAAVVDLSRVAEEADEGSVLHCGPPPSPAIRLGKGKWPDDFMSVFQYPARGSPPQIPEGVGEGEQLDSPTSASGSPPRQRVRRPSNSVELTSSEAAEQISPLGRTRRRSSRSVDVLLPKEVSLAIGRDSSPSSSRDSSTPSPGPATPGGSRQPIGRRSRTYAPRTTSPEHDRSAADASIPVPFPRSVSGEHSPLATLLSSSETLQGDILPAATGFTADTTTPPPYQRTRHRSELDKRSSFDDQPAQRLAGRSRFESMVNLGGANDFSKGETSLIGGMDGSAVRKSLVVKEEGKLATHYQLGNCIGRGQFGSVYRALNLNTGQMVAVKRIRLEGLSETEVAQLTHEVEIVKRLSHPSIVKYEGMAKDSDTLSIVLEYAENGSLAQTLKAFGKLNEGLVASYVTKVLEGLHYLHTSQVVHCDLKAANILTTKTGNVKLSDFGVSLNLRVRAMEQIKNDIAGTPNWMAPEVIELRGASPASDIWSLACTIIELLTGRPPYADVQNGMSVMFRIVEDPMPPIPEGLSEPLQDFLTSCFNKDPAQRPNAEMLFEHPWLKSEWGLYKELRPQDSIPFLRRVSADLQRSDVRHLTFLEEDGASSPRSSNGFSSTTEFPPRPHTFVKSTFSQAVTCRVCNQPVKKSAVFCTECSLIAHSKCAAEAPQTCDLRAQVIRLSQDLQREAVRQQSPPPNPVNNLSSSPPKQSESPLSSSPPDRLRIFGRKKSKAQGLVADVTESPKPTTPPVAFKYDDTHATKRTIFSRPRNSNNDDRSRSRASVASSQQSSSMRSAATAAGSLSSGVADAGARVRSVSMAESELHRDSRITDSSMASEPGMNAGVGEEAYLKRRGSRREKKEAGLSRTGCIVQ
ncbi:hypothetical protein JB92DRAFT_2881468 [Gautieria morchelliformis]|nr:hypothetical protein JB92DRAFT_2881468 [Gautieria morchelliformis]